MNDAVDRVITEREAMDRGFPRSLWLSVVGHVLLVGSAVAAPLLRPQAPIIKIAQGIVVPLPPGGGGPIGPPEPPAKAPDPKPEPPAPPAPEPEKKQILKPPKEKPPEKKGLPEPDAKPRRTPKKAPTPEPVRAAQGSTSGGTGSTTPGLDMTAPIGPGVPGGTDPAGDWYLAGVQRKIWALWNQQIRTGPQLSVTVRFTIRPDGNVSDVQIVQSSGVYLLDQAAQRAVYSAAPFGPLPEHYAKEPFTIQASFKPVG